MTISRRMLLTSAGAALIIPTGVMAQTPPLNEVFYNKANLRIDIPSAKNGPDVPRDPSDGLPSGPATVAAMNLGKVMGAGPRKITAFLWGTEGAFTVNDIPCFDHPRPRSGMKLIMATEVSARNAPKFDPVYDVKGVPRVFEINYTGVMVSIALPRRIIGKNVFFLLCPLGPAVYPHRTDSDGDGLWHTPDEMAAFANGPKKVDRLTVRAFVFP